MAEDSFAALMKQAAERGAATGRRLHPGEIVRAKVMQIAGDSVFVDVGTPGDGRIPRAELSDENGALLVEPGSVIEAAVVDASPDRPRLTVSRRALLEERRRTSREELLARLVPGTDVEGTVRLLNKHGAVVDLDGIDGFIHISELARHRVERVEDVVQPGERVKVRVLSIEESEKGPRVRLSRKVLEAAPATATAAPEEVLRARVVGATNGGLTVNTAKGEGFLPISELGLPPGADHRRAFPPGKELDVVLVSNAGGRARFSATQVARVEERKNYRDYAKGTGPAAGPAGFGQLGDLLRERLGLPAAEEPPSPSLAAPPAPLPSPVAAAPRATLEAPVAAPKPASGPGPASDNARQKSDARPKPDAHGVVRRRR